MSCNMIHTTPIVNVLADSEFQGSRLTTLKLQFWRPILPELSRHRVYSLTFRSSRATPTKVYLQEVRDNPWGPAHITLNQRGMVGKGELTDESSRDEWYAAWKLASLEACTFAERLSNSSLGPVAKEVVNRVLEPYVSITGIISGTEWDNFFKLRIAPDAQGEIRDLALAIKEARDKSQPHQLQEGEWHLPYISDEDRRRYDIETLRKASAARCARVSIKAFDGTTSIEKDVELGNRLISSCHFSPLEMVAQANSKEHAKSNYDNNWLQFRKIVE